LQKFIAKYESQIAGVLSGFDRLVFRGSLRKISYVRGMQGYLWARQVLLKDFASHVQQTTERVKQAALQVIQACGRPVQYLYSSGVNKEEVARAVAEKDRITQGPVCALTCVEPCLAFDVYRNRQTRQLDLVQRTRKCLFVYQYWQHPVLGWMNALPVWIRHALTSFGSPEVMRFLGKKLTRDGQVSGNVAAEIVSDCRRRQEGVRIKHRYNRNSVKLYDKAYTPSGSVLRAEMTMDNPEDFQVYRRLEGHPKGALAWQRMRKGIADLHRRAQVSQKVNDRYLDALAQTDDGATLDQLLARLHSPVLHHGKRVRAMRPFAPDDRSLLQAISQGQFTINGFRNRDLQALLYDTSAASPLESRRRSAAISRKLRLLRAHHLIRKVSHSYRYQLTPLGRQITTAVLAASNAPIHSFVAMAAA
jgi:hypothetical protein